MAGLDRFSMWIYGSIEYIKEDEEGYACNVEQQVFAIVRVVYGCQFGVRCNEQRGGGEDAVYFKKCDRFGAAVGHEQRVLAVAR